MSNSSSWWMTWCHLSNFVDTYAWVGPTNLNLFDFILITFVSSSLTLQIKTIYVYVLFDAPQWHYNMRHINLYMFQRTTQNLLKQIQFLVKSVHCVWSFKHHVEWSSRRKNTNKIYGSLTKTRKTPEWKWAMFCNGTMFSNSNYEQHRPYAFINHNHVLFMVNMKNGSFLLWTENTACR